MIAYCRLNVENFPFYGTFLLLHRYNSQIIHIEIIRYSQITGKIYLSFATGKRAPKARAIDRLMKSRGLLPSRNTPKKPKGDVHMKKFWKALGQAIVDGWMVYSDSICR